MAGSKSTVEILFKANDQVSKVAENIKKSIGGIGGDSNKASDGVKGLITEFDKAKKSGDKLGFVGGIISGIGDKVRGLDTTVNASGIFGKWANGMNKLDDGFSNLISNFSGVASAIHPALGIATEAVSIGFKMKSVARKMKVEFMSPIFKGIGVGLKELYLPMGSITKGFQNWANTLQGVASGIYVVKNGLSLIEGMAQSSDNYVTNLARLGMAGENYGESSASMYERTLKLAKATRSTIQDSADITSKLGINVGKGFENADDLFRFTETINKALTISGASGTEKQSSLLQLTQALSSGVLQGDELRSLMENAPYAMQILADGLGIARGELKKWGKEGKLTTESVIDAIMKGSSTVDKAFENIPMRFADIKNQVKGLFQESMSGTYQAVSDLLNSKSVKKILKGAESAFEWFGDATEGIVKRVSSVFRIFSEHGVAEGVKNLISQFGGLGMILSGVFKGGVMGKVMMFAGLIKEISKLNGKGVFGTVEALKTTITSGLDGITTTVTNFLDHGVPVMTEVIDGVADFLPDLFGSITSNYTRLAGSLETHVPNIIGSVSNFILKGIEGARANLPQFLETTVSLLTMTFESAGEHTGKIGTAIAGLITDAMDWVDANPDKVQGALKSFGTMITNGLEGLFDNLNVTKLTSSLTGLLKDALSYIDFGALDIGGLLFDAFIGGIDGLFGGKDAYKNQPKNKGKPSSTYNITKGGQRGDPPPRKSYSEMIPDELKKKDDEPSMWQRFKNWWMPESKADEVPDDFYQGGKKGGSGGFGSALVDGINNTNVTAKDMANLGKGVMSGLSGAISDNKQNADVLTNAINQTLSTAFTTDQLNASLQMKAGEIMQSLSSGITAFAPLLLESFQTIFQSIGDAVNLFAMNGLVMPLMMAMMQATTVIQTGTMQMSMAFSLAFMAIGMSVSTSMLAIVTAMSTAMMSLVTAVQSGGQAIISAIDSSLASAVGTAQSYVGAFASVGASISHGIASGILAGAGAIISAVNSVVSSALSAATSALAINSPSKVFANIVGRAIPEGIALGINKNEDYVTGAMDGLTGNLTRNFSDMNFKSNIGYKLDTEAIKENKDEMSEALRSEILASTKIRFIDRVSSVTNAPIIKFTGDISKEVDLEKVAKYVEDAIVDTYEKDLRYQ